MKFINRVSKQTAQNPVARAVARDQLHKMLNDQRLRLYLKAKGDACAELANGLGSCLTMVYAACVLDRNNIDLDGPQVRILRGGISTCQQLASTDKYEPQCAVAIDMALECAESLNKQVSPLAMTMAWCEFSKAMGVNA